MNRAKKDTENPLPKWMWWVICLFAMYGFITFMDRIVPCKASEGCDLHTDYDPADI